MAIQQRGYPGSDQSIVHCYSNRLYTVVIADSNGCSSSTTTYILVVGVEDLLSDQFISLYPNPSDGSFTAELFGNPAMEEVALTLYSTLGLIVYQSTEKLQNHHLLKTIDVSEVPDGIYFMKWSANGADQKLQKLVITK